MFIPPAFREAQPAQLHGLIESHPLGLLVTHGERGLQASPVPFVLYADEGTQGVLRAHVSRGNAHWQDLAGGRECLIVFRGEDGYVSPSWYPSKAATGRVVPTWNYVAVEVRGVVHAVEDAAWLHRQVRDLTERHEGVRPQPWSVDDAPADYIGAQIKGIVGLEIVIAQIEGKWKVSQNRSAEDRDGVRAGLTAESDPHHHPALAQRMRDR